jgi:hypothetical protein
MKLVDEKYLRQHRTFSLAWLDRPKCEGYAGLLHTGWSRELKLFGGAFALGVLFSLAACGSNTRARSVPFTPVRSVASVAPVTSILRGSADYISAQVPRCLYSPGVPHVCGHSQ